MKVLFVTSGNILGKESPVIRNQAESLIAAGLEIDYFLIYGKGVFGYLRNIPKLKRILKTNKYDVIHAHYGLCGMIASLSNAKPLVVSIMGSELESSDFLNRVHKVFDLVFWKKIIVKSERSYKLLNSNKSEIIPNGVDLKVFHSVSREEALIKTNFSGDKKNIIFVSDPERNEKNFKLAEEAIECMNDKQIELHYVFGKEASELKYYYSACDLLLMTSKWESSPNVIKEAMACNCPIVTTEVGDVRWVLGETEGCFLTTNDPDDVAAKIKKTIEFGKRTIGIKRIIELGLDSKSIANRIIDIYNEELLRK